MARIATLFSRRMGTALVIDKAPSAPPQLNPQRPTRTSHMAVMDWEADKGWSTAHIKPCAALRLDPAASSLHYGIHCYEELKAYKSHRNELLLFRPHAYLDRFLKSIEAASLPPIDKQDLLNVISEFVRLERDWVSSQQGWSLYLRLQLISAQATLGVARPKKAKFVMVAYAAPPEDESPIKVYCKEHVTKSWLGGVGDRKLGATTGPLISLSAAANEKGYPQMLWLVKGKMTELTTMNFFCHWKNNRGVEELVTPQLDSTILPGVTRSSILQLAKEWDEFTVTEGVVEMNEFVQAAQEGRVLEAFACSTTLGVVPLSEVYFHSAVQLPLPAAPLSTRLSNSLHSVQSGLLTHYWAYKLT